MKDQRTALAKRPSWKAAESLESARKGEVMVLDDAGRVLSSRERSWQQVRGVLSVTGMGVLSGALVALLMGSVVWGVAVGGGMLAVTLWQMRHAPAVRRALALAADGRRDEALAAVEKLERRRVPGWYRPTIDYLMGKLLWQSGRLDEAAARYGRAIDALQSKKGFEKEGMYWLCAFDRVQLLTVAGQRERVAELLPGLDGAPEGEYFHRERSLTELAIAFHEDRAGTLDDDDLHAWARDALGTTRAAHALLYLAWAFDARGDEDMADHVFSEALDRLDGEFLAESDPKLFAWMEERRGG